MPSDHRRLTPTLRGHPPGRCTGRVNHAHPTASRRPLLAAALTVLGTATLAGLAGCAGDDAPDTASGPLTLVVDDCRVSHRTVPAGRHAVAVEGQGRVTLTDPGGGVVLTARGGEEPAELELSVGTYGVTCEPEGGAVGETRVRVTQAG
jgi:hypothetical protein